jgi:hypothetical protein
MRKLKTIRSISISLGLAVFLSCASTHRPPVGEPLPGLLSDLEHTGRYRVHILSERMELTGILVVRHPGDEWRGSVINEFGVKAFDFIVKNQKCRLLNTLPLLNKWYIRKTIESDFSFLFQRVQRGGVTKGKSLQLQSNRVFRIKNERQNIEYTFLPMTETKQTLNSRHDN